MSKEPTLITNVGAASMDNKEENQGLRRSTDVVFDYLQSTNEKLDRLNDKMDQNNKENRELIHSIDLKVSNHQKNFDFVKWVANVGAGTGIAALIKAFFFG